MDGTRLQSAQAGENTDGCVLGKKDFKSAGHGQRILKARTAEGEARVPGL